MIMIMMINECSNDGQAEWANLLKNEKEEKGKLLNFRLDFL